MPVFVVDREVAIALLLLYLCLLLFLIQDKQGSTEAVVHYKKKSMPSASLLECVTTPRSHLAVVAPGFPLMCCAF